MNPRVIEIYERLKLCRNPIELRMIARLCFTKADFEENEQTFVNKIFK